MEDLRANTEYTGYTSVSTVVQWFWEVAKAFNKEDQARLLQFVTGTSKVCLAFALLFSMASVRCPLKQFPFESHQVFLI